MKLTKWNSLFVVCVVLAAVVLHTCVRIELLNASNDYYLPRTDWGDGNPKWRCSAASAHRQWLDREIANDRYRRFTEGHPEESDRNPDQFLGPPYTVVEQSLIDTAMANHKLRGDLYGWVCSFGLLQYLLAPLAFCVALVSLCFDKRVWMRYAAAGCAISVAVAIGLMIYRGYFASLGW